MFDVAPYRLLECAGFDLIKCCKVKIEHGALAADFIDFVLDGGKLGGALCWGGTRLTTSNRIKKAERNQFLSAPEVASCVLCVYYFFG